MNTAHDEAVRRRHGMLATLSAFIIWGLSALYFRAIGSITPLEIVAHRILWSALLLGLMLTFIPATGRLASVAAICRQPRLLALLAFTSLLTSSNWLIYIWSIDANRLLEASLGYFINPLVSIALGAAFFGERLRALQRVAVAIAVAGVLARVWQVGNLPWIALYLAGTFGIYGALRKRAPVGAVSGLFIETIVVTPFAIAVLLWLQYRGELGFGRDPVTDWLLPLSGVLTALPLMLFTSGAQRLPLASIGFLQYIAPSLGFLIAVFIFGEAFDAAQLISFALIWLALAVYSVDLLRSSRRARHELGST